ncbi:MAG: EAL domain-containing protein [Pseudomonadota bacterium]
MKILVATNDSDKLILFNSALKKLGHHELVSVTNSYDAIYKSRLEKPDLVILDISIEEKNSPESAKHIREIYLGDWIPILFIVNFEAETIKKIIAAGGDDYLLNPLDETIVLAKLKFMLNLYELRLKNEENMRKFGVLSAMDSLTGVQNRTEFDKSITAKINDARSQDAKFAVLSLDIDHFKMINDNLGHHIGDLLLKSVATRIKKCLGMDDFIARIGSDEFSIILGEIDHPEAAEKVAQKIINGLMTPHNLANEEVHMTCSIGIACYPVDGENPKTLMQNAEIAMSHAKELGRNNYQLFAQELYEKRKNTVNLEEALKFAVDREELFLTYQPIYDLQTHHVVGMEALLSWQHPSLGLISPNIFIPIAEENGLIDSIGKWTFRSAFAQGAKWYLAGYHQFKLAINISPRHLLQKNLPALFTEIIIKTQVPPHILEFELTENASITSSQAENVLADIHLLGIGLSLDDFGTGYSSYIRLKQLPINTIKIDKVFIDNLTSNTKDAMIVKSMITLGKNLGIDVIAEGIETAKQAEILIEYGCPKGQGFYLSKPLSVAQMTEILQQQHNTKKS